jgi:hypothetical protein
MCIKKPTCLKDVQRLTGCVAAISRFVSRLGEKALPLYKMLKKTDKFVWDDAADACNIPNFQTKKKMNFLFPNFGTNKSFY